MIQLRNKSIWEKSILFVCTGNICRSAYCKVALEYNLRNNGCYDFTVDSAGTMGIVDAPMDLIMSSIANGKEYKSIHKAKRISESLIKDSGIILCLEEEHRQKVVSLVPSSVKRTFLLSEFSKICELIISDIPDAKIQWDDFSELTAKYRAAVRAENPKGIPDPYRMDEDFQHKVAEMMETYLQTVNLLLCRVVL